MRQRQLFLDAQKRASQATSPAPPVSILQRIWRSVSSNTNPSEQKEQKVDNNNKKAGGVVLRAFLPIFITAGLGLSVAWSLAQTSAGTEVRCYCPPAWAAAIFNKVAALQSVMLMGLASTVVSGTVLCMFVSLPNGSVSRFRFRPRYSGLPGPASELESSEVSESSDSNSSTADIDADTKFESLFYDEYDTMMAMAESTPSSSSSSSNAETSNHVDTRLSAVPVTTPRCELVITYVPARSAFGYYTDRKDAIPYTHLETAARMFLVKNARPDLARLAYVDRRNSHSNKTDTTETSATETTATTEPAATEKAASSGIFAMFKSYNRKPAAASAPDAKDKDKDKESREPSKVSDTHFVYMGTMQDYKNTRKAPERCGSGGSSDETPYVNIKYSEFKKNKV